MMLYDTIGKTYTQTRQSDPRIARKLLEILEPFQASPGFLTSRFP